jgi:iron complex outermembrane receptor protein
MRARRHAGFSAMVVAGLLQGRAARAQVVAAEPLLPISAPYPPQGDGREVQIVVNLVVGADGHVESAIETSRAPLNAPEAFTTAALEAARRATFRPSTRDTKPIRSRIEYVVVFRPPANDQSLDTEPIEQPGAAASPSELSPPSATSVTVRAPRQERGLGEFQIDREFLEAAPHMVASEQLSAAPGFFVDHEDSEGLGNDVHLRGFDSDHGSGIEFRVGAVPVNQPLNAHMRGYADVNFVIPEVVRSIGVLEGVYDPRQGDAAIAGSAAFDLGVAERGYHLKGSYGSFQQRRLVAIVAPPKESEETFLAFAWRETDGFGPHNRASSSGSTMGAYAFDFAGGYRAKLSVAAYGARAALPGFVRRDDFDAGRIGFYDSYAGARGQSALASRAHVSFEVERSGEGGERAAFAIWGAVTGLRSRENFTGSVLPSPADPALHPGDLFETTNDDAAFGVSALVHSKTYEPSSLARVTVEPGLYVRAGSSDQAKSLIEPSTLAAWDRLIDARVQSLDAGGYFDADLRLFGRLRFSGGLRADALLVGVDDRLAGAAPGGTSLARRRAAFGVALSPRVSAELDVVPWLQPVVSYGEGFRSLEPLHLSEGETRPYSKVRSIEAGVRSKLHGERYRMSLSLYQTWVENEIVFDPESGGLETEGASLRRGVLAAILAKPVEWMAGSLALTYNRAEFTEPRDQRFVPEVPSVLFRADVTAHGELVRIGERRLEGHFGTGTTYIAGRHITDTEVSSPALVLNARAGARYGWVEVDVDIFNLLGRRYPDDEAIYASNWSSAPGAPTVARHFTAAAPFTLLATLSLHFGG